MDSVTLQSCLFYLVGRFADVYTLSRDNVRKATYQNRPLVVACNTTDSSTFGKHWIIFVTYQSESLLKTELYDSFGNSANYYGINYPYDVSSYNTVIHQNDNSPYCGHLCVLYIYTKFHRNLRRFRLTANKKRNEELAQTLVRKILPMIPPSQANNYTCKFWGCYP